MSLREPSVNRNTVSNGILSFTNSINVCLSTGFCIEHFSLAVVFAAGCCVRTRVILWGSRLCIRQHFFPSLSASHHQISFFLCLSLVWAGGGILVDMCWAIVGSLDNVAEYPAIRRRSCH
eukprot:Lithocolla_globosa_v1_NODE_603_length_3615_cov_160.450562.p2 type:complete len:120 gc:universal NODE_603_length_3615_cov_160.450562:802-1161(+)